MNPNTKNANNLINKLSISKTIDHSITESIEKNDPVTSKINTSSYTHNSNKTNVFRNLNKTSDNYYEYDLTRLEDNKNSNNYKGKVNICIYTTVTENSIQPFLLYLLYKDKNDMKIPYINTRGDNLFEEIESKIEHITNNLTSVYKGQLLFNNELYVFYQLDDNVYSVNMLTQQDVWWFALITEICYLKKIMTFDIDTSVYDFFMNHTYLCKLYDKHNNQYMSPHPLYYGSNIEYIEHIVAIGVNKNSFNADFGPFYNFGSYDIGARYGGWSLRFKPYIGSILSDISEYSDTLLTDNDFGRYTFGGIVRFAVFLGNHKTFLNRPHDKEDKSRYADGANIIAEKRKIVDVSGSWAKKYNSIHKGEMDIHQYNLAGQKGYTFVVKKFNQQYPLTYHKLDKNKMNAMYNPKTEYSIE